MVELANREASQSQTSSPGTSVNTQTVYCVFREKNRVEEQSVTGAMSGMTMKACAQDVLRFMHTWVRQAAQPTLGSVNTLGTIGLLLQPGCHLALDVGAHKGSS